MRVVKPSPIRVHGTSGESSLKSRWRRHRRRLFVAIATLDSEGRALHVLHLRYAQLENGVGNHSLRVRSPMSAKPQTIAST